MSRIYIFMASFFLIAVWVWPTQKRGETRSFSLKDEGVHRVVYRTLDASGNPLKMKASSGKRVGKEDFLFRDICVTSHDGMVITANQGIWDGCHLVLENAVKIEMRSGLHFETSKAFLTPQESTMRSIGGARFTHPHHQTRGRCDTVHVFYGGKTPRLMMQRGTEIRIRGRACGVA